MIAKPREELSLLIRSGWRLIALESFEEDRAVAMVQRVAEGLERSCDVWSLATGFEGDAQSSGSFDAAIRAIAVRTSPALFVILDAHRVIDDPLAIRRLRDVLPTLASRKQALILLGPALDLPAELQREAGRIELPLPGEAELRALFLRVLEAAEIGDANDGLLDEAIRGSLGLTATESVRVFRKAIRIQGGLQAGVPEVIVREKRRALRRTPSLTFHEDHGGLGEVGGLGELKQWLGERRSAFGSEARRFGLPAPRGLLLLGVQGCGKSVAAKAVAKEWQFPLLRLDLAAAFGSSTSSPEASIRETIAVAESLAPVVLWIDEIEKGFAGSGSDPSSSRVFGSFLTWLSEKQSPVFVVATANDVHGLPPELLRRGRFDELFFVDLPTSAERAEILAIHLRKRERDPLQFPLEELAEEAARLTGAELEQAVTAALYVAFADQRDLSANDLINAIGETVPLYDTYEERIKELRDWGRGRTRPASIDAKMVDYFGGD
ncbi:MAG: AAA family ATPase [Deltaproteobacteria bacterium]|nr:AAA family ATPase [Deltaproteobacteria bacterium]